MARDEAPPKKRGSRWYDGVTADIPAAVGDRGYQNLIGKTWDVEDYNPETGVWRSNRYVTIRFVYNASGVTIYAKQLCKIDPDEPGKVLGCVIATNEAGLPADEYLPTGGVPDGDGFYVVERGPAIVSTAVAELPGNITVVGDIIVGATIDATSGEGADTGRIGAAAFAVSSQVTDLATVLAALKNCVGKAMSANVTSGVTDTETLVDVGAGIGL